MRRTAFLCIAFCAAFAQEDPRARAREIERQAERALDEGRRTDALKLLAEAADLRARARGEAADRIPFDPRNQGPKAEPVPQIARPAEEARTAADLALKDLDGALGKGDAAAALKAGPRARDALAAWATDLEERERRLAEKQTPVERRVEELERRVRELKEIADRR